MSTNPGNLGKIELSNYLASFHCQYIIYIHIKTWHTVRTKPNSLTAASKQSVTLSTPALRMKLPFLFHFRAKMGPLCCPSVLARFPFEMYKDNILSISTLSDRNGDAVYKCETATTLSAAVK